MRCTLILALGVVLALLITPSPANAVQTDLVIDRDGMGRRFTAADLLARPDNVLVTVQDSTVGRPTNTRGGDPRALGGPKLARTPPSVRSTISSTVAAAARTPSPPASPVQYRRWAQ